MDNSVSARWRAIPSVSDAIFRQDATSRGANNFLLVDSVVCFFAGIKTSLYDRDPKKIMGMCGGLSKYSNHVILEYQNITIFGRKIKTCISLDNVFKKKTTICCKRGLFSKHIGEF
ncbi:MAG: hypothetical protein R3C26_22535 [Calditrichia bacterium]